MKGFPFVTVLATILAMLVSEYLFHFPSKMLHDGGAPIIQVSLPGVSEVTTDDTVRPGKVVQYCTAQYDPVCGKDRITYPNACEATRSHTQVAYTGTCDDKKSDQPIYEEVSSSGMTDTLSGNSSSSSTSVNGGELIATGSKNEGMVYTGASTGDAPIFDTGSYHVYQNASLNYGFALPKYTYYQGYSTRDGAAHTMAVSLSSTGIDTFDTADVRIWYYRKLPDDTAGKKIINLLDGGVVLIAGDESNPRVAKIIETIEQSTKNLQ